MEYREFLENVRKEVESRYDSNVSVTLNHVMKNNGTELDGITIMEKDKNIAPTIYINSFYDRYREGVSLKAVVSEIIRIYNQNKNSININADYFENYENVRKTIVYKLVNYQKNKKLLEDVPYKRVLDLAVVFYCLIEHVYYMIIFLKNLRMMYILIYTYFRHLFMRSLLFLKRMHLINLNLQIW